MRIALLNKLHLPSLLEEYGLNGCSPCAASIGNDQHIHILLSEAVPGMENGVCMPSECRERFWAVSLAPDWKSGDVRYHAVTDFGMLKPGLSFVQRLGDGFLLARSRARLFRDGTAGKNARVTDAEGNAIDEYCLGDGISQCLVDGRNRIITGYYDEGIFGNYGWNDPIGSCGVIVWSAQGKPLWKNWKHDIVDCYAINIDAHNNLYFYYYTEFDLVRTNYETETVFHPEISGSSAFLLHPGNELILFDAGYQKHGEFVVRKVKKGNPTLLTDGAAAFFWEDERIAPLHAFFRTSKALLWDEEGHLYYTEWNNDTMTV